MGGGENLVFIKNRFRFVSNNGTKKQVFRGALYIEVWIKLKKLA